MMLRSAAFVSNVVASMPIVFLPLTKGASASRCQNPREYSFARFEIGQRQVLGRHAH